MLPKEKVDEIIRLRTELRWSGRRISRQLKLRASIVAQVLKPYPLTAEEVTRMLSEGS